MKSLQFILALLFVWQIAASSFLENTKRAEYFELTDDEIPDFKITMPDSDYEKLIEELSVETIGFNDIAKNLMDNAAGNVAEEVEATKFKDGVTLEVEIKGEKKVFNKITFAIGGSSARNYGRQGFNIKIRGKEKFYGRTQFRLRSDARDATFLRSKIACDIHNKLGLVSIAANYASLYVNGNYLGFYIIMDSPKLPWIEEVYGEKDTKNLIKCKIGGNYLSEATCATQCENENEDVTDNSEWVKILRAIDNAKTPADLENIFEIDHFLYEAAYEYLVGTWDHLLTSGHNYSMYKQKNGKWIAIYYDFDGDFGQDIIGIEFGKPYPNPNKDYPTYSYKEWFLVPIHLYDVLIANNPERFENILRKMVTEVFNPAVLFPRIDELKKFIKPEVVRVRTPDKDGKLPGVLNNFKPVDYTLQEWDANVEFTTIHNHEVNGSAYGLKYWILTRYRKTCEIFNLECDPVYLDKDYKYTIDKNVESVINTHKFDGVDFSPFKGGNPYYRKLEEDSNSTTTVVEPATTVVEQEPTQTETQVPIAEPTETEAQESKYKCLAELAGYPCCAKGIKKVYEKDAYGEWSYDFAKKQWCGLTPYEERAAEELCWSEIYGYPCCKGCYVFESDDEGQWGYEDNQWCGIQPYCSE